MKNFGFPKSGRLRLQRDFEDIFKNGKRVQKNGLVLWWKPVSGEEPKMGIVVSRKLGLAHQRNRAKRLIREVFRLNRKKITSPAALVISPRTRECLSDLAGAQKAVLELFEKAGLIKIRND